MSRRLVPMPTKRAAPPPVFEVPGVEYEYDPPTLVEAAPVRRARWDDNLAAKVRATPTWVLFLWLVATAVLYAFAGPLILFIVGFVFLVRGWLWLSWRFPQTMFFISLFIVALLSGAGRRRRW